MWVPREGLACHLGQGGHNIAWARIPCLFGGVVCNMLSVPSIFQQGEGWLFCALILFSSVPPSLTSPSSHQFRQCGGCLLPYAATQGLVTGFSRFASHGTDLHLVERFNNILVSEWYEDITWTHYIYNVEQTSNGLVPRSLSFRSSGTMFYLAAGCQ